MAKGIAWTTLVLGLVYIAIRAVATGDPAVLKIMGMDAPAASAVGIAAFPMSPLWSLLALSLLMIAAGNARLG